MKKSEEENDDKSLIGLYYKIINDFLCIFSEYSNSITDKYNFILIDELKKIEDPADYLYSHILKLRPLSHLSQYNLNREFSKTISCFINDIESSLSYWNTVERIEFASEQVNSS